MPLPLEGIRVIELANFIAGPFCGMLLADMGADVVKVEPLGTGEMSRATPPLINGQSAGFMQMNRNKRSLALDLKAPAGARSCCGWRGGLMYCSRISAPARWSRSGSRPTSCERRTPG
jgi:crotonobetainyl-CoA:carnitine CoA-transferase CaiB-like acyl-CoA transferase